MAVIGDFLARVRVQTQGYKDTEAQMKHLGGLVDEVADHHASLERAGRNTFNTLEKGVIGVANETKSFSKIARNMGSGSTSIVGIYATLAANVFALSAAFNALRGAAQVQQVLQGLDTMGNRTGVTLGITARKVQELSGGMLDLETATRATAQFMSSGLKGGSDTLLRMTQLARDTSIALGRNMPDSMDRLTRGIIKLEPELLDELGLMTRIGPATALYAQEHHKAVGALTTLERQQAFANAVLAEGELKFHDISEAAGNTTAYDKLAASVKNLTVNILSGINTGLLPFLGFVSESKLAIFGLGAVFVSTISKQLLPMFNNLGAKSAAFAESLQAESIKTIGNWGDSLSDASHDVKIWADEVEKGTARSQDFTRTLKQVRQDIAEYETYTPQAGFNAREVEGAKNEIAALKDIEKEMLNYQRASRQAAGHSFISSGINLASGGNFRQGLKDLRSGFKLLDASVDASAGRVAVFSNNLTKLSAGVKFLGAAFINALPYIGLLVVALGALYNWATKLTPAQEKFNKALEDFNTIISSVSKKAAEIHRIDESTVAISTRAAKITEIRSNAISELVDQMNKLSEAQAEMRNEEKRAAEVPSRMSEALAAGASEAGPTQQQIQDMVTNERLRANAKSAQELGISASSSIYKMIDASKEENKVLLDVAASMEKLDPRLFHQLTSAIGEQNIAAAKGKEQMSAFNLIIGQFVEKEQEAQAAVSEVNEAFKNAETAVNQFITSTSAQTPFDNLAVNLRQSQVAVSKLQLAFRDGSIDAKTYIGTLSGIGTALSSIMDVDVSNSVDNFNTLDMRMQVLRKQAEQAAAGSKERAGFEKEFLSLNTERLEAEKRVNREVVAGLKHATDVATQLQEQSRTLDANLSKLQAQRSTYASIYSLNGTGMAEQFAQEEKMRDMQVSKLKLEMDYQENLIAHAKQQISNLEVQKLGVAQTEKENFLLENQLKILLIRERINQTANDARLDNTARVKALQQIQEELNLEFDPNRLSKELQARIENGRSQIDIQIQGVKNTINDAQNSFNQLQLQAQALLEQNLTASQKLARENQKNVELSQEYINMLKQQATLLSGIQTTNAKINEIVEGRASTISSELAIQKATLKQQLNELDVNSKNQIEQLRAQRAVVAADAARAESNKDAAAGAKEQLVNIDNQIEGITRINDLNKIQLDRQALLNELELVNFNVRKEGLDWQKEGLDLQQKALDVAKDLGEQQLKNSQVAQENARIRIGIPTTDEFTAKQDIQAKEQAYVFALRELKVRETMVDLEYALLEARRTELTEELRQRREILLSDERLGLTADSPRIKQLSQAIHNLEEVSTAGMADKAKQLIHEQAEGLRLELERAALPVSKEMNAFMGPLQSVLDRFALRSQQTEAALVAANRVPGISGSSVVAANDNSIPLKKELLDIDDKLKQPIPIMTQIRDYMSNIDANVATLVQNAGMPIGAGAGLTANANYAMRFFTSRGMSAADAAAVVGNLQQESGANLSTTAHNNIAGGHSGIAQWDASRAAEFQRKYGIPVLKASLDQQLDFVWTELQGRYKSALTAMANVQSVQDKTKAFEANFEKSGGDALDKRMGNAITIMQAVGNFVQTVTSRGSNTASTAPVAMQKSSSIGKADTTKDIEVTANALEHVEVNLRSVEDIVKDLPPIILPPAPPTLKDDLYAISGLLASTAAQWESMGEDLGPQGKVAASIAAGMAAIINVSMQASDNISAAFKTINDSTATSSEKFDAYAQVATNVFAMITTAISQLDSILAASANARIANIDAQIAAEQRADGKSAESVARIDALSKRKDSIQRKEFNIHKKLMMAEAVMSTAAGVANALRLPPPLSFIMAGIIGALGAAQIAIIAGTQYQSSATPSQSANANSIPSIAIGAKNDSIDLAKNNPNAGGEIGYLRGAQGSGTNSSDYAVVGSAYGGPLPRGYGNLAFRVGEKGPETIRPIVPMTVESASTTVQQHPAGPVHFHIQALDAKGVEEILLGQRGNIIGMLREAANANGQPFLEDVNTSVYTSPKISKL